ncbi:MAG: biotin--[acetyl-CoA-carboxylase] ligase [Candidatus Omnitrophica bacterium]|nr:biotin--[acetyl-CoA-carboxylase] ligase [Candidatus Omnitrophota bacterium]
MHERILDFLKSKKEYVSGEELSVLLKVSRQALWKHIQQLKDAGYDIVAVPHLGYRLINSPDRLFPVEIKNQLHTKYIARNIHYLESVSSTMDIAEELAIKGAPDGTVVIAESQTKGRGRMARTWHSPKYKGIYLSLILRPKILPGATPVLTLLCAVSICEAIDAACALQVRIKWPNDILLQHKKVGGILTELNAEMDSTRFVIIGIGLNVNNDKNSLIPGATSLREHNKEELNRVQLLQEILRRIESNYLKFQQEGAPPIIQKWKAYNITLGKRIKLLHQNEHLEGMAVDIDKDGGLLLRNDAGLTQKVTSGDIVHCR